MRRTRSLKRRTSEDAPLSWRRCNALCPVQRNPQNGRRRFLRVMLCALRAGWRQLAVNAGLRFNKPRAQRACGCVHFGALNEKYSPAPVCALPGSAFRRVRPTFAKTGDAGLGLSAGTPYFVAHATSPNINEDIPCAKSHNPGGAE